MNELVDDGSMANENESIESGENLVNLKNAVIVGIRLNEIDFIKNIDMNEISH